jgi:hypothetical protein
MLRSFRPEPTRQKILTTSPLPNLALLIKRGATRCRPLALAGAPLQAPTQGWVKDDLGQSHEVKSRLPQVENHDPRATGRRQVHSLTDASLPTITITRRSRLNHSRRP